VYNDRKGGGGLNKCMHFRINLVGGEFILLKAVKGNFFMVLLSILILLSFSTIASSSVLAYAADNTVQVVIGSTNGILGSIVEVPISFTNVSNELAINNCDFVISYDVTKLSFEGVDPGIIIKDPTDDFSFNNVLDSSNQSIGQVNFLFNDESNDNSRFITASGLFAKMKFKINNNVTPGSLIKIEVKSVGAFSLPDAYLTTRSVNSINGIITVGTLVDDRAALNTAITNAVTLIGSKTVGDELGNVPIAAKTAFQNVIDAATIIYNNASSTQIEVNDQITALSNATTAFNSAIITVGIPSAPTTPIVDDARNLFGWTNNPHYTNISDYEFSVDNGQTWATCTANPQPIKNESYIIGTVKVRVKADINTNRPSGSELISANAFTQLNYSDLNNDTFVNSTDYGILKSFLLGKITDFLNGVNKNCGDFNGDGFVNSTDYGILKSLLLGKITKFPVEH
jgi:hypothetical protein